MSYEIVIIHAMKPILLVNRDHEHTDMPSMHHKNHHMVLALFQVFINKKNQSNIDVVPHINMILNQ